MRISYDWLQDFLSADIPPAELAKHLLLLGFEVSDIQTLGPGFDGVVVGEVLEVAKHPNADRLSLCSVKVGNETLSIVCGAKNVVAGARVPVARIGARLPGGRVIQPTKIRGTQSQGMICSAPELGLADSNGEGILILPPESPVGADAASLLGKKDHALDIDIPPNRPDCLSHLGLARELSIHFNTPLKTPALPAIKSEAVASRQVRIEAEDGCRRYLGRDLLGLRAGPSPGWLIRRLETIGLRPINNVVDVTNYVLFELGQPLHAFDAQKLTGEAVLVRRARSGERLKALDGKEYPLADSDLVIADASGPIALAGVIGGEPTQVTEKTNQVFLESAYFEPGTVRRTARRLGLRTDASFRFERGCDIENAAAASDRATGLLLRLSSGTANNPTDVYPGRSQRAPIDISTDRVNKILGSAYPEDRVETVLKSMAAGITPKGAGLSFTPPSYRLDLATPWDLAEEVGRHLGYDSIPAQAGPVQLRQPEPNPLAELSCRMRRKLLAEGFFEAYNVDFISEAQLKLLGPATDLKPVRVLNPLSEDQAYLRPTLLLGLLQNAVYNLSRGSSGLRLFELGRAYKMEGSQVQERACLAGLQIGDTQKSHWQAGKKNSELSGHFYDIKGVVEELIRFHPAIQKAGQPCDALFHPQAATGLCLNDAKLGAFGLLHPALLHALDLKGPASAFLLDLDALSAIPCPIRKFVPFSTFPSIVRDLSIVLDRCVSYAKVRDCLRDVEGLAKLELIDLYEGKGIPAGKKSLTLRLTFSSPERTLRDAEVQEALRKALERLDKDCGASLRA